MAGHLFYLLCCKIVKQRELVVRHVTTSTSSAVIWVGTIGWAMMILADLPLLTLSCFWHLFTFSIDYVCDQKRVTFPNSSMTAIERPVALLSIRETCKQHSAQLDLHRNTQHTTHWDNSTSRTADVVELQT